MIVTDFELPVISSPEIGTCFGENGGSRLGNILSKVRHPPPSDSGRVGRVARREGSPRAELSELSPKALRFYLQSAARELLPDEAVADCLRQLRPGGSWVQILYSPSVQASHFGGLRICSRLWVCPVCASKIGERRREELAAALSNNPHLRPLLATFTLRHNASEPLQGVLDGLLNAYRSFTSGKAWVGARRRYGIVGSIKALEPTHGLNGWHPHLHVLFMTDKKHDDNSLNDLLSSFRSRWLSKLAAQGKNAAWDIGVDLRSADRDVADYVAKYGVMPADIQNPFKWTISHEMTKAQSKKARSDGGRTPLHLLADYAQGDEQAGKLFLEYAAAFKGRHQLVWSDGLKALLGVGEKSDEEIAEEFQEDADVLALLAAADWRRVILRHDLRAELLEVAASGDRQVLLRYLHQIGVERVLLELPVEAAHGDR